MHAIDHITRPATMPEHDFQWFCEELDRVIAQLRERQQVIAFLGTARPGITLSA